MRYFEHTPEPVKNLTPLLDFLGYTTMSKMPLVRIHRQIQSRRAFLMKLEQAMYKYMKYAQKINILAQHKYFNYLENIKQHLQYVEDCSAQLDINNTIDVCPYGNMAYTRSPGEHDALFKHEVLPFTPLFKHWKKYWDDYPQKLLAFQYRDYYAPEPGYYDEAAAMLMKGTYAMRRANILSRLQWELRSAHRDGWFMVFDTVTISNDMAAQFDENPHSLRDYFRSIGYAVLQAEGRSTRESFEDCYRYFCVPELGGKNGRLHFHCIHFCRTLPKGSRDPNEGRRLHHRRQIESFRGFWKFGFSMPIAMRYHCDAYTRQLRWFWPTDKNGMPIKCTGYQAIGFYVTKYVCKNIDTSQDEANRRRSKRDDAEAALILGWQSDMVDGIDLSHISPFEDKTPCQTMSKELRKQYRVRMSRSLGRASIPTHYLSLDSLEELTRLHHTLTPYSLMMKRLVRQELLKRVSKLTLADILTHKSPTVNLLASLRSTMKQPIPQKSSAPSSTSGVIRLSTATDVSEETLNFLKTWNLLSEQLRQESPHAQYTGSK